VTGVEGDGTDGSTSSALSHAAELVAAAKLKAASKPIPGSPSATGDASSSADPGVLASTGHGRRSIATCVVCLSSPRNTVALPCRHCCLCRSCADEMRRRSQRCPICRTPIALLLHIDAFESQPDGDNAGSASAATMPPGGRGSPVGTPSVQSAGHAPSP